MTFSLSEITLSKDEQNKIRVYADVLDLSIDEVIHKMLSYLARIAVEHINTSLNLEEVQHTEPKFYKIHRLHKPYKDIIVEILKDYPEGLSTDEMLELFPEGANKGTLSGQISELFQYGILNRTRTKPKRYMLAAKDEKTN